MRWQSFTDSSTADRLYGPEMRPNMLDWDLNAPISAYSKHRTNGALAEELAIEVGMYLPNDILAKVDRMSMAVSLEVRVPFLDHELVEFAASLPSNLKMRMLRGKYLLRKSMAGRLPKRILSRRKQGFSMPIKRWLGAELFDRVDSAFSTANDKLDGLLEMSAAREMLDKHRAGLVDYSHQLWSLFVLVSWLQALPQQTAKTSHDVLHSK